MLRVERPDTETVKQFRNECSFVSDKGGLETNYVPEYINSSIAGEIAKNEKA